MLAAPSYPDYDGFTVYLSGTTTQDSGIAEVIRRHAAAVAELNRRQPQARQERAVPNLLVPANCPSSKGQQADSQQPPGLPSSSGNDRREPAPALSSHTCPG
jgi:hypothetical protein